MVPPHLYFYVLKIFSLDGTDIWISWKASTDFLVTLIFEGNFKSSFFIEPLHRLVDDAGVLGLSGTPVLPAVPTEGTAQADDQTDDDNNGLGDVCDALVPLGTLEEHAVKEHKMAKGKFAAFKQLFANGS